MGLIGGFQELGLFQGVFIDKDQSSLGCILGPYRGEAGSGRRCHSGPLFIEPHTTPSHTSLRENEAQISSG